MIRLATAADYPPICAFLHEHWRRDHVFTQGAAGKRLFDWQHWNGERYNFVLHLDGDRITGVLGFIPIAQFDRAIPMSRLIWLTIWKSTVQGAGVGKAMLDWLEEELKPEAIATVGASEMTLPMYEKRGWVTGKMDHWYMPKVAHHSIMFTRPRMQLIRITDMRQIESAAACVNDTKTARYLQSRYIDHSVYKYSLYRTSDGKALIVTRRCSSFVSGIRIVDLIGDSESLISHAYTFQDMMAETNSHFIDFYCSLVNNVAMRASGFTLRTPESPIIIPNHFEPFEHRNVDILYACSKPGMRHVKGDGDMDRPNIIC